MSSSGDDNDELEDLEELRDKILKTSSSDQMQVSAWDDDNEGIEESRAPTDVAQKEILEAAEKGDLEKVKSLFDTDPTLITCTDEDGYTPLHRACYGNHVPVVEFLLNSGAKINAKTQDDWQPLHSACCWNNVECASILISRGADINAKSKGEQTPLHLACNNSNNSAMLQLLLLHPETNPFIKNSSGDTPEDIAKRNGKYYPLFEITEPCLNEF